MPVAVLPIGAEASEIESQKLRGEILDADGGED